MNEMRQKYNALPAPRALWAWGSITLGLTLWLGSDLALTLSGHAQPGTANGSSQGAMEQAIVLGLLLLFFVPPLLARHEVGANEVVVSLGPIFRGHVAYDNMADIRLTDRKPLVGLGLRVYPHTLYALTWPQDLVAIRLKRPQRFWMAGVIPLWKVDEIVFNVAGAQHLCSTVRARLEGEGGNGGTAVTGRSLDV